MLSVIRKFFKDLLCDDKGNFIYEKVGANTAHLVGSYTVLYQVHHGGPTEFVFMAYLAFAGGHAAFSKHQDLKYGTPTKETNEPANP